MLVRTYMQGKPLPEMRMSYARALLDAQRHSEALAQLQAVTRERPDLAEAWLAQGTLLVQDNQLPPAEANHVWAYDFVFDTCANNQSLKCLTVIDEYTRECLAIDVAGSIGASRVIEVLTQLVSAHGAPTYLRSDNGPEFVSRAVLRWLQAAQVETALNDPGKPWQNGADESFNGKFRDECLSVEWFRHRVDATMMIEHWRRHYNEVRPHSSLDYRTPVDAKSERVLAVIELAQGGNPAVLADALRRFLEPDKKRVRKHEEANQVIWEILPNPKARPGGPLTLPRRFRTASSCSISRTAISTRTARSGG